MALREFSDERRRRWLVWEVPPAREERRRRDTGPPPGMRERRGSDERPARLRESMSRGWLAFEADDGDDSCRFPECREDWKPRATTSFGSGGDERSQRRQLGV